MDRVQAAYLGGAREDMTCIFYARGDCERGAVTNTIKIPNGHMKFNPPIQGWSVKCDRSSRT
jgi:hypothetical protein